MTVTNDVALPLNLFGFKVEQRAVSFYGTWLNLSHISFEWRSAKIYESIDL